MNKLNEEQIKDIKEREAKALEFLRELQLSPACQLFYENIGNDGFVTRAMPYLQDVKYSKPAEAAKEPVAAE